jgi:hypothetical protein
MKNIFDEDVVNFFDVFFIVKLFFINLVQQTWNKLRRWDMRAAESGYFSWNIGIFTDIIC